MPKQVPIIDVELRGTNRVRNQLRFLASAHPDKTNAVIKKHAKETQKKLRSLPYPPYLPHFKHQRKGFFGGIAGSYSAKQRKKGVWEIKNSRLYAGWVISALHERNQHPSFRPWYVMKDEIEATTPDLVKDLTVMLEHELEKQAD